MADYNASTVKTLAPLEHMRQYPGMYIGSKDADGLHHLVKEIISNSIDEYLNGAGDTIIVQLNKDGSIYIEDNGRGIPHGKHESGCSVLQACFGIANTVTKLRYLLSCYICIFVTALYFLSKLISLQLKLGLLFFKANNISLEHKGNMLKHISFAVILAFLSV